MAMAAVKLQPLFTGPQTVSVPTEGTGGFHKLLPTEEPASVGAPPVMPSLADGVEMTWPARFVETSTNHVVAAPTDVAQRPTAVARWTLKGTEFDTLVAWINGTLGVRKNSFDWAVDGPGSPVVKVRATAGPRFSWDSKAGHTVELDVEEVF